MKKDQFYIISLPNCWGVIYVIFVVLRITMSLQVLYDMSSHRWPTKEKNPNLSASVLANFLEKETTTHQDVMYVDMAAACLLSISYLGEAYWRIRL